MPPLTNTTALCKDYLVNSSWIDLMWLDSV